MASLRVGIYATGRYIVIIALGMGYAYRFDGTLYGTSEMITHFWRVELVLTLFTIAVAVWHFGWCGSGFGRVDWGQLVWMLPAFTALGAMLWVLLPRIFDGTLADAD